MREGGGASPATPAAAARSSTWRLTRAPMRGASTPRILNVSSRIRRLLSRRQLLRGDLGLDPLRLGGVEVQLDLDAVRVVHEELVQRLAVRAPLLEFHVVPAQVRHGLLEALRAKRNVVDRAGSRARVL